MLNEHDMTQGSGHPVCTDVSGGIAMAWVQLLLLVLVTIALPGCEVVGGIFKAGAWVGALAVILVVVIVGILAAKIRG